MRVREDQSDLNLAKAKSAALTAALPSLPMMPSPTWASWIIETSLPPSPTAAVMGFRGEFFIILTISAFCSGDIRQQTTAWHLDREVHSRVEINIKKL